MTILLIALLALVGCGSSPSGGHGHSHGGGHAHGGGGDHADHGEEEGESIAITRWTASHELFVELDAPVAGQAFSYHAHVTRLVDNHAATSGVLTLRFEDDGFAVESHTDSAVARPGIFAAQAPAPAKPGAYRLVFAYADGDERAEWDGGVVTVGEGAPVAHDGEDEGEIAFLKETQWQIPFAVGPAREVPLAPTVRAAGVVQAAPGATAVVAAPADGLLAWTDGLPVVGRRVRRGERVATLIPAGAAEHWSRIQADVATARVDLGLAEKELARVEELAGRDLLPARRLEEARAGLERATAELSATQRRASALTSGGAGAMPVLSPADGFVVSVGGGHGSGVSAGDPLVAVSTGAGVLIEGRVHERSRTELGPVASLAVSRGDWSGPRDLAPFGARLLTERLVFDPNTLSAPISVLVDGDAGLSIGDIVELNVGVGVAEPRLAVPRSAVVEINGQDIVFVQKTGESFSRRRVTLGVADPTHVEVLTGVEPGEMVVVEGGFDVHVASLSGALESHRH